MTVRYLIYKIAQKYEKCFQKQNNHSMSLKNPKSMKNAFQKQVLQPFWYTPPTSPK